MLTIEQYMKAKKLKLENLVSLDVETAERNGKEVLKIPYYDEKGFLVCMRYRLSLEGKNQFSWRKGDKVHLYGLNTLQEATEEDPVFIVEGETDYFTLEQHGFYAIGVPGAGNWREDRDAPHLERFKQIYVVMEPDKGGKLLVKKLSQSTLSDRIKVIKLKGFKDVNDLHIANPKDFKKAFKKAIKKAIPISDMFPSKDMIDKGSRNIKLTSIAGKLRAKGLNKANIRKKMKRINKNKCNPPLPEKEIEAIVNSISKYPKGKASPNTKTSFNIFTDDLIKETETFHTVTKDPYAVTNIGNRKETWHIMSSEFKTFLQLQYHNSTKKMLGNSELTTLTGLLSAKAQFESSKKSVHIRIAGSDMRIHVDLANKRREIVEITPDGWKIITDTPYYFVRPNGMKKLPRPKHSKNKSKLKQLFTTDGILIAAWLLGAINPEGPYPILVLQGGPGSAKSTTTRMIKNLIDPNEASIRAHPRSFRDMIISAKNTWVLAFDNLSEIPRWFSDGLCQLSTGGGYAVRKQYRNASEHIFNAKRPVILNGIDYLTTRSDLADRSIVIELPPISDEDRLREKDIWESFRKYKAYVLGELFTGISQAMKNINNVNLKYTPRMADFTQWVVASEPGMYWKTGLFLKKYKHNNKVRHRISLYSDDMATCILAFMRNNKDWKGTADELIKDLKKRFNQKTEKNKIPNSSSVLAKELRRATHILEESGLKVTFDRSSTKRKIKIKWRKTSVR